MKSHRVMATQKSSQRKLKHQPKTSLADACRKIIEAEEKTVVKRAMDSLEEDAVMAQIFGPDWQDCPPK